MAGLLVLVAPWFFMLAFRTKVRRSLQAGGVLLAGAQEGGLTLAPEGVRGGGKVFLFSIPSAQEQPACDIFLIK